MGRWEATFGNKLIPEPPTSNPKLFHYIPYSNYELVSSCNSSKAFTKLIPRRPSHLFPSLPCLWCMGDSFQVALMSQFPNSNPEFSSIFQPVNYHSSGCTFQVHKMFMPSFCTLQDELIELVIHLFFLRSTAACSFSIQIQEKSFKVLGIPHRPQ